MHTCRYVIDAHDDTRSGAGIVTVRELESKHPRQGRMKRNLSPSRCVAGNARPFFGASDASVAFVCQPYPASANDLGFLRQRTRRKASDAPAMQVSATLHDADDASHVVE